MQHKRFTPGMSASLKQRLVQACDGHMTTYAARYNQASGMDQGLEVMHPRHLKQASIQALSNVGSVIVATMRRIHPHVRGCGGALPTRMRPNSATHAEVVNRLAPYLAPFLRTHEGYADRYARFLQIIHGANESIAHKSYEIGDVFGHIGKRLLGTLGGVLFAMGAAWWTGKQMENQIEAEAEQLEQHFQQAVRSYEEATSTLRSTALEMLEWYFDELVASQKRTKRLANRPITQKKLITKKEDQK